MSVKGLLCLVSQAEKTWKEQSCACHADGELWPSGILPFSHFPAQRPLFRRPVCGLPVRRVAWLVFVARWLHPWRQPSGVSPGRRLGLMGKKALLPSPRHLCRPCHDREKAKGLGKYICRRCHLVIDEQPLMFRNDAYHPDHFSCTHCGYVCSRAPVMGEGGRSGRAGTLPPGR